MNNAPEKHPILFIDDEGWTAKRYTVKLELDFDVQYCEQIDNGEKIITNLPKLKLMVLDVMMPTPAGVASSATENDQSTGIWFLRQVKHIVAARPLPVIILTNKNRNAVTASLTDLQFPDGLVLVRSKTETQPDKLRQLAKEMVATWHA